MKARVRKGERQGQPMHRMYYERSRAVNRMHGVQWHLSLARSSQVMPGDVLAQLLCSHRFHAGGCRVFAKLNQLPQRAIRPHKHAIAKRSSQR